ncbi:hypothetical protein CCACVL1_25997, partial [Corchorus capsularis]
MRAKEYGKNRASKAKREKNASLA